MAALLRAGAARSMAAATEAGPSENGQPSALLCMLGKRAVERSPYVSLRMPTRLVVWRRNPPRFHLHSLSSVSSTRTWAFFIAMRPLAGPVVGVSLFVFQYDFRLGY